MTHANDNDSFNFMAALHAVRDNKLATEKMHKIESDLQLDMGSMQYYCSHSRDEWIDEEMVAYARKVTGLDLQKQDLYRLEDGFDFWECRDHAIDAVDARIENNIAEVIEPYRESQKYLVNTVAGERDMLTMDVHVINQSFRKQHAANYHAFEDTKTEQVTAAREAGSEHPERDVYNAYKTQQADLEQTRQDLISTLYSDYGFTQEQTRSLSQSFNAGM